MNQWYLGALAPAVQPWKPSRWRTRRWASAGSLRRFVLSWLYADLGALDQARALATQLARVRRAHHNPLEEARGRWVLAEVLRREGDLDGADREVEVALAMAVPLDNRASWRRSRRSASPRAAPRRRSLPPRTPWRAARPWAGAACSAARSCASPTPRRSTRPARTTPPQRAIADARARLLAIADKIADPDYGELPRAGPENARTLALARAWLGEPAPA